MLLYSLTWWGLLTRLATSHGGDALTVSERIGMPSLIGWLVNNGPWSAFGFGVFGTVGMIWILRAVFEGKIVGIHFHPVRDNFKSMVYGDVALAGTLGLSVAVNIELPTRQAWWNSSTWHLFAVAVGVVVCLGTRQLKEKKRYSKQIMWSWSKVYHDFVLYIGFLYLLLVVGFASLFGVSWSRHRLDLIAYRILALVCLGIWLKLVVNDDIRLDDNQKRQLAAKAHGPWVWRPDWLK